LSISNERGADTIAAAKRRQRFDRHSRETPRYQWFAKTPVIGTELPIRNFHFTTALGG